MQILNSICLVKYFKNKKNSVIIICFQINIFEKIKNNSKIFQIFKYLQYFELTFICKTAYIL